jgi:hypothetical protein
MGQHSTAHVFSHPPASIPASNYNRAATANSKNGDMRAGRQPPTVGVSVGGGARADSSVVVPGVGVAQLGQADPVGGQRGGLVEECLDLRTSSTASQAVLAASFRRSMALESAATAQPAVLHEHKPPHQQLLGIAVPSDQDPAPPCTCCVGVAVCSCRAAHEVAGIRIEWAVCIVRVRWQACRVAVGCLVQRRASGRRLDLYAILSKCISALEGALPCISDQPHAQHATATHTAVRWGPWAVVAGRRIVAVMGTCSTSGVSRTPPLWLSCRPGSSMPTM